MIILPLTTKLFIPRLRHNTVPRPRLLARLDERLQGKLTLISAPAGFGKTTLAGEWVANLRLDAMGGTSPLVAAAWLSLDEGDKDPVRFLTYLVVALQTLALRCPQRLGRGPLSRIDALQRTSR